MIKKMFSFNNHFLDNNILLGKVMEEDDTGKCRSYFQHTIDRHISMRVKKECLNVLGRLRYLSLRFLSYIKRFFSNQDINLMKFDQTLHRIKRSFIRESFKESYYGHFDRRKFDKIISDLSNKWSDDLREVIITGTFNNFKKIEENIKITFRESNKSLRNIFNCLNINVFYKRGDCGSLEEKIKDMGIHKSDSCILLDCFELSRNHLNENVAFITQDQKICENNENLKEIFNYSLEIFDLN